MLSESKKLGIVLLILNTILTFISYQLMSTEIECLDPNLIPTHIEVNTQVCSFPVLLWIFSTCFTLLLWTPLSKGNNWRAVVLGLPGGFIFLLHLFIICALISA